MLQLRDLCKSYRKGGQTIDVLRGVTLDIGAGEFLAVQGPSGCGKSTLLMVAGAVLAPDAGTVSLDGTDPYKLSGDHRAKLRAEKVGFVFQQFHLVPYLDVLDNVMAPSLARAGDHARQRAMELIERFGLLERIHHVPAELSVGERQRTVLARALLNSPRLLLADEPTGNLDADNAKLAMDALAEFASAGGAVLLVTHDANAAQFAGRKLQLVDGKLTAS